jgi:beta-N-acetylhexosaminidase
MIQNIDKRNLRAFMPTWLVLSLTILNATFSYAQQLDSLDIKIGQLIMVGMPSNSLDSAVLREVKSGKVGAIIYFEKNIPKTNSFAGFKKMSWAYQQAAPIPLLICIDQEGGKVNRLKEKYGFPRSITAAAIGKSKSLDSARFYAESTAATLAGLGINVNFAPCVDLAANPDNTVIVKVERAYSNNEDSVIMYAREVVKAHRKFGILTSLKHFPGHGSSTVDTHFGIADVTKTWNEREIKPYKQLIKEGYVDGVMSSHIVNQNLDPKALPGTLSQRVLDSLLRKVIGYDGVVFSDDMQMNAIDKFYGLGESIKLAVNGGIDILCFSNNIRQSKVRTVDTVHTIIRRYVESGEIKRETIDNSFGRILKLKSKLKKESDQLELANAYAELQRLKNLNQQYIDQLAVSKPDKKKLKKKRKG